VVPGVDGTWSVGFALASDPAVLGLDAVVQPVLLVPALPIGLGVGHAFWLNMDFCDLASLRRAPTPWSRRRARLPWRPPWV
jgi:hypothetical protein